jgi:hypothetical protein
LLLFVVDGGVAQNILVIHAAVVTLLTLERLLALMVKHVLLQ